MSFPGAGAGWRATITRTWGKPSPSSSQPPSNSSTTCPVFILVTLAVGLSSQHALTLGALQEQIASASRHEIHPCQDELRAASRLAIFPLSPHPRHPSPH